MNPSDDIPSDQRKRRSRWRAMLFRLGAVLLSLAPLVLFEGVCIVFGWGEPSQHDDPFVGFHSVRPLFVLAEDGTRYEIPKARQAFFRPASFPADKSAGEFRIFCLGGSTVQGRPFAVETSFTTWLELSLQAADPSRRWRVVNCGGVSYASYRLVPILEEVQRYEPDLIVLYTGHNEFLEDRSYQHIKDRPWVVNAALETAARSRTYTLLREGYLWLGGGSSHDPPEGRAVLPTEVEALLDYRGGLEDYHRDDDWRQGVIEHLCFNVRRMVQMAADARVPLILVNPVSNLGDTPPFKAQHREDLTPAELTKWESLCAAAREHLRGESRNVRQAAELFSRACEIDPRHAGTYYSLAKCYEAAGMLDEARSAYLRAKEEDICPLRILQPMNDAVLEIAAQTGTPLVDAQELFAQRSPGSIVAGDWLVDHVHPSIEGHQLLADVLADELISLGFVVPRPGWKQQQKQVFQRHYDSLGDYYFHKGMQRLENLRLWAQGRADGERPSKSRLPGGTLGGPAGQSGPTE